MTTLDEARALVWQLVERRGAAIAAVLGDAWPKATEAHAREYERTYRRLIYGFRVEPTVAWARCHARGLVTGELPHPWWTTAMVVDEAARGRTTWSHQ